MDLGIAGKTAIVTASSTGLGRACAEALAAERCNLVLFARSADKLKAAAADMEARHGVRVLPVAGDMRERADIERMIADTRQAFGGPDILVLNTGRPPNPMREVLKETDDQRWEDAYRTQLWGAIVVARLVAPILIERGWGRIISITSATVKQPMHHHGLSTVYRSGVTGFMKHLANEIAPTGVTVNTVCPASIGTEALTSGYNVAERAKTIPVRRLGTPSEFASAVAYFASVQSGFITGASLHVDGGMVASLY